MVSKLREVEIFREFTAANLRALEAKAQPVMLDNGQMVFRAGDPPRVYALVCGRVTISTGTTGSRSRTVDLFNRHAGQVFGEISLFLNRQINEARAVEESEGLSIDVGLMRIFLRQDSNALAALGRIVAERIALTEARVGELGVRRVKERLALVLDELAVADDVSDDRGYLIRDRLTQIELARMVGASRVAVNRALMELRRSGQIIIDDRRIMIPHRRSPRVGT